jgi:hypothetical protein
MLSNAYVLGTDGNLWLEAPGWQQNGRIWVDDSVQAFAPDTQKPGYLYVEGTDHNLWLEAPGWNLPGQGRTLVDSSVQAFAVDPDGSGNLYVEGTDHNLWLEAPGWQKTGRTQVDSTVQAFAPDPFDFGSLYVTGAISAEYDATAYETDAYGHVVQKDLGVPTSGELNVLGVAYAAKQTFQGGAIYWSAATGAHVVYGGIGTKYNSLGGPVAYGLPVSDEAWVPGVPGVRVTDFQIAGDVYGSDIYWSAATGAHAVYGAIGAEYLATAFETDAYGGDVQKDLGAPTSDEENVPGVSGARMNTFQGGAIYWSAATGAHVVYGAIFALYNSLGGPTSFLGLPTSDEQGIPGGRISYFQYGWIEWTPSGGAFAG